MNEQNGYVNLIYLNVHLYPVTVHVSFGLEQKSTRYADKIAFKLLRPRF